MKSILLIILMISLSTLELYSQKKFKEVNIIYLGVDYNQSENLSGLGIGIDFMHIFSSSKFAMKGRICGGPAWGKYKEDLSNSYIRSHAIDQMSGDTYIGYSPTDRTDGGITLSSNILFTALIAKGVAISIGPRLSYFSKQDISVFVESSDAQSIWTESVSMPYIEKTFIPGIEFNLEINPYVFKYSYLKLPGIEEKMHMVGFSFMLSSI